MARRDFTDWAGKLIVSASRIRGRPNKATRIFPVQVRAERAENTCVGVF